MQIHSFRFVALIIGLMFLSASVLTQNSVFTPILGIDTSLYGTYYQNQLGRLVSGAGDINGDGYDDILIGTPNHSNAFNYIGKVELHYGTPTGVSAAIWVYEGSVENDRLGDAVTAADINNDGFSDVIIGYSEYTNVEASEGALLVFYGSVTGLNNIPDYIIESNQTAGFFGQSVKSAGDVNNDNYDDIVVGSYDNYNGTNYGTTWVYYGSAGGLNEINKTQIISTGYNFGQSVSGAGDVNGDNYDDIIVGQPEYNNGTYTEVGRVLLYYGSSSGIQTTAAWTKSYNDPYEYSKLGESVSSAGDVNNDGFADVICSAPQYKNGAIASGLLGRVYIFLGSSTGLAATTNKVFTGSSSSYTGKSVSNAGDMNGDGFDDIIFGVSEYDAIGSNSEGAFFVYKGSSTGITNDLLYSNIGAQSNCKLGASVASAGDVNNDGFSDVIASAYLYNTEFSDVGKVIITFGRAGEFTSIPGDWHYQSNTENKQLGYGIAAGDINGDNHMDIIAGAMNAVDGWGDESGEIVVFHGTNTTLGISPDYTKEGDVSDAFGVPVSSLGDVNGDGFDDLVVSIVSYSGAGFSNCGKVMVYYGSASGLSDLSTWSYTGNATMQYLGRPAKAVGDLNGDGFDDIAVGVSGYVSPELNEGAVYIFYGNSAGLNSSPDLIIESDHSDAGFGYAISGVGDINGDGYDDLAISLPYLDAPLVDEGAVNIYFGSVTGVNSTADHILEMNVSYGEFGTQISNSGDVNQDGFDDILIGSYHFNGDKGRADLYFGGPEGIPDTSAWNFFGAIMNGYLGISAEIAGDLNHDSYPDIALSESGNIYLFYGSSIGPLDDYNEYYANPFVDNTNFGNYLAKGGDVNNDAVDDLLISNYSFTDNDTLEGALFAFYGFDGICNSPATISVEAVTSYTAELSWETQPDVLAYIYRWKPIFSSIWNYGSTNENSVFLNSLTNGIEYEFELQNFCETAVSTWTQTTFTTLTDFTCNDLIITGLTSSTADGYDITLSWDLIDLDIEYSIRYKQTTEVLWNYLSTNSNSFTLDMLDTCKTYYYEVAAICEDDTSIYTTGDMITVTCPPCYYKPTDQNVTQITSVSAKIVWSAVAGVSYYRSQFRKSGAVIWKSKFTSSTSSKLKNLEPSTTYEYRVQSVCGIYSSAYTPIDTFTTLPLKQGSALTGSITAYPNPASDEINLTIKGVENQPTMIEMYNINAEIVFSTTVAASSQSSLTYQINTSSLNDGLYLIVLKQGSENQQVLNSITVSIDN